MALYEIIYEFVQLTVQLTEAQLYGFNRMKNVTVNCWLSVNYHIIDDIDFLQSIE